MPTKWRIDEYGPYDDVFEDSLLDLNAAPAMDALIRASKSHDSDYRIVVEGRTLHVIRVPENQLLIIYAIDEQRDVIQPMLAFKLSEGGQSVDEQLQMMVPMLASIIRDANEHYEPPVRRPILFPVDPTTIDRKRLEDAIDRVVSRR